VSDQGKAKLAIVQETDGEEASANLFVVEGDDYKCLRARASEATNADEDSCERFLDDSGANKHLHPEPSVAASFVPRIVSVNTADGAGALKTQGVGAMNLETPSGCSMPGFKQVLFECCREAVFDPEAGLICVFDAEGMKTYKAADYKCDAQPFTQDGRDSRNGLYYLTLRNRVAKTTGEAKERAAAQFVEESPSYKPLEPPAKPLAPINKPLESSKNSGGLTAKRLVGAEDEGKTQFEALPEFVNSYGVPAALLL